MKRIYVPATEPDDWKPLLADPDKHWKTGYSAHALAHCWHDSDGWPVEIKALFKSNSIAEFQDIEPLLVIPEHVTSFKGKGGHPHSDIFVLARSDKGCLISIAVEGKAEESFGTQALGEWKQSGNIMNRRTRLDFMLKKLALRTEPSDDIPYQLLQRTVCAVVEAERFNAKFAAMIIHSFSPTHTNHEAFVRFVKLFREKADGDHLTEITLVDGIRVFVGWADGSQYYLTM